MTNVLLIIGGVILAAVVIGYLWLKSLKRRMSEAKAADQERRQERLDDLPAIPLAEREDDKIYQWSFHHGERLVAHVNRAEVDEGAKRVTFGEIFYSDKLFLPDACQFRKFQLEIDTVGDAVKVDHTNPEKGRILRDVTANITGYVEH